METAIQKRLNLGCGTRFKSNWKNVDFTSSNENVKAANLLEGIPFPNKYFDIVYHSHLLEHFSRSDALVFLNECSRVMKVGGIIRVVVPDLESIAREYLVTLDAAKNGKGSNAFDYDWMLLEMYDQVTRNYSGGEMAEYLFQNKVENEGFVIARCGAEAKKLIELGQEKAVSIRQEQKKSIINRVLRALLRPSVLREKFLQILLGTEYEALQIGRFRLSGENHQWMYDSFSLTRLLSLIGFKDIVVRSAVESYIPDWAGFQLDTEQDGSIYKPDSLYIEAIKR